MKKVTSRDSKSPKNSSPSSSSDFEFTVSISPRKSSTTLCPADELFSNGRLLPLHHSRRVSSVHNLLSSSSSSSSGTSRDSTASSDSSRPSLAGDEEFKRFSGENQNRIQNPTKKSKQFSLSRFSSVFRKSPRNHDESRNRAKGIGSTAKEVIKKYLKKVMGKSMKDNQGISGRGEAAGRFSVSFSGNLRYPRERSSFLPSCPSSSRASPNKLELRRGGVKSLSLSNIGGYETTSLCSETSSMEELHSAIQGAIVHCKNSLVQNKNDT